MPWHVDLAVMLSQVGVLTLPPTVLERIEANEAISPEEQAMVDRLPALAEQVLAGIPRLEEVRAGIRLQGARYADPPSSPTAPAGDGLPLGARVLRVVQDYDSLALAGRPAAEALKTMTGRPGTSSRNPGSSCSHGDTRSRPACSSASTTFPGRLRCGSRCWCSQRHGRPPARRRTQRRRCCPTTSPRSPNITKMSESEINLEN